LLGGVQFKLSIIARQQSRANAINLTLDEAHERLSFFTVATFASFSGLWGFGGVLRARIRAASARRLVSALVYSASS
jgi:hypothetical protein